MRVWLAVLCIFMFTGIARADSPPPPDGIIVGIRGKIIELQPAWLRAHVRLIVDDRTKYMEMVTVSPAALTPGTRVAVWGEGDPKKGIKVEWMVAGDLESFRVHGKQIGIQAGWGGFQYGGTLKSVKPFVVRDDAGTDITAGSVEVRDVRLVRSGSAGEVMVGGKVRYQADRTTGGIIHVTSLTAVPRPGRSGVLFATMVSRHGNRLTVLPRFARETMDVSLAAGARVQRQVTLDPGSVRVGQTVTAWGTPAEGADEMIAFALLRGNVAFPAASPAGSGGSDQTITGNVATIDPVTLRRRDGKTATLYITGQTPLMSIGPASADALHPGTQAMLLLSKASSGKIAASYVMIDASPILAYGM